MRNLVFFIAVCSLVCCQAPTPAPAPTTAPAPSGPQSPDVSLGALFEAVQMAEVFPDSKTFADCTPKIAIADILKQYESKKKGSGFDLKAFVLEHFELPVAHTNDFKSDLSRSAADHINALWPVLTRQADQPNPLGGTLLPLPKPFIVPGGRFGEVYYWDSYFTMLGLESAGKRDMIENMVTNFAFLIDTYGHIPNGNRTYYLSRSQPPFFSLMVRLLDGMEAKAGIPPTERAGMRYVSQLEKEYAFWMQGSENLSPRSKPFKRVVRIDEETLFNRYWDDLPAARPESYREDRKTADAAVNNGRTKEDTYLNIKAAAESGWDFSSRWGVERDLTKIQTTQIAPVDLNCLMWHLEQYLCEIYQAKKDAAKTEFYGKRAYQRAKAIRKYCWNQQNGWFMDVNLDGNSQTNIQSLAGMFPLFFNIADAKEAALVAKTVEQKFLRPGGVVTTLENTGQQWDAPNGWAPLEWITIQGLRNYKHQKLATDIKQRWITLCTNTYQSTGKMLEKYNVENAAMVGGGEYPVQDGFGWSNGVLLRLLSE